MALRSLANCSAWGCSNAAVEMGTHIDGSTALSDGVQSGSVQPSVTGFDVAELIRQHTKKAGLGDTGEGTLAGGTGRCPAGTDCAEGQVASECPESALARSRCTFAASCPVTTIALELCGFEGHPVRFATGSRVVAEFGHEQASGACTGSLSGVIGEDPYPTTGQGLDGQRAVDDLVIGDGKPGVTRWIKDDLGGDAPADRAETCQVGAVRRLQGAHAGVIEDPI